MQVVTEEFLMAWNTAANVPGNRWSGLLYDDWPGVVAQVGKWQSANSLAWSEPDVLAVARYLNESFYHFEPSAPLPAASTGTARP